MTDINKSTSGPWTHSSADEFGDITIGSLNNCLAEEGCIMTLDEAYSIICHPELTTAINTPKEVVWEAWNMINARRVAVAYEKLQQPEPTIDEEV